jgi:hypothetical protein
LSTDLRGVVEPVQDGYRLAVRESRSFIEANRYLSKPPTTAGTGVKGDSV